MSLDAAVAALLRGEVVVIPTDTVYGVAVDPTKPGATDRLFELKRRPRGVPLPVLVSSVDQMRVVAEMTSVVSPVVERFWPGGLTIVLRRNPAWPADLGEAGDTIGVRCPDHPVPRELANRVGPIAATSANRHGLETPSSAFGVSEQLELGPDVVVIDGGVCDGAPSTVVDLSVVGEARLLREGVVAWEELRGVLG